MAAISVQDDADVARHRLLFELINDPALVNPIKKAENKCGCALVGWLSLDGLTPSVKLGRGGGLFVKR